jgi:hypothetical protein
MAIVAAIASALRGQVLNRSTLPEQVEAASVEPSAGELV